MHFHFGLKEWSETVPPLHPVMVLSSRTGGGAPHLSWGGDDRDGGGVAAAAAGYRDMRRDTLDAQTHAIVHLHSRFGLIVVRASCLALNRKRASLALCRVRLAHAGPSIRSGLARR